MKPATTVLTMYVLAETAVTLALWCAPNAESIVTIAMTISAAIAKPARIALKEMVGATTAMSAATAFQISASVAKAVWTA